MAVYTFIRRMIACNIDVQFAEAPPTFRYCGSFNLSQKGGSSAAGGTERISASDMWRCYIIPGIKGTVPMAKRLGGGRLMKLVY